nr:unnamed protein product [Digitaria exilis]
MDGTCQLQAHGDRACPRVQRRAGQAASRKRRDGLTCWPPFTRGAAAEQGKDRSGGHSSRRLHTDAALRLGGLVSSRAEPSRGREEGRHLAPPAGAGTHFGCLAAEKAGRGRGSPGQRQRRGPTRPTGEPERHRGEEKYSKAIRKTSELANRAVMAP